MKIIAVAGLPASGKTMASEVAGRHGVPFLSMGDVVREEAAARGVAPTGKNLAKISLELVAKSKTEIVRRFIRKIMEEYAGEKLLIIEGVREYDEVKELRKHFDVSICAFVASFKTRLERMKKRKRSDDPSTARELAERDSRELGYGVGEVIERADKRIVNEGTKDEAVKAFEKIVREFKES